ncbi:MAG: hypothetical protein F6K54_06665 [Okeania sp. SIO3B5]|nr:hypothetical protein [Okeania sp. SIO3B5]NEO52786.1 hypothetical protein [Okeania sp. SIO3B5]
MNNIFPNIKLDKKSQVCIFGAIANYIIVRCTLALFLMMVLLCLLFDN